MEHNEEPEHGYVDAVLSWRDEAAIKAQQHIAVVAAMQRIVALSHGRGGQQRHTTERDAAVQRKLAKLHRRLATVEVDSVCR